MCSHITNISILNKKLNYYYPILKGMLLMFIWLLVGKNVTGLVHIFMKTDFVSFRSSVISLITLSQLDSKFFFFTYAVVKKKKRG